MKVIARVKLFLVLGLLGVLGLLPASASCALPDAIFYAEAGYQPGYDKPWDYVHLYKAGTCAYDIMYTGYSPKGDKWYSQFVATALLSTGRPPMVDIMSAKATFQSAGYGEKGKISGRIIYYVTANKEVAYAPDVTVPLLVTSKGSIRASGCASVGINSSFGTLSNPWQDFIIAQNLYEGGPGHWEGTRTIQENVPLGVVYAVQLQASGIVTDGNGEFQALIDPEVKIDPAFTVHYNGKDVPGTQLYSLKFSKGFDSKPLPGVLMLLLD